MSDACSPPGLSKSWNANFSRPNRAAKCNKVGYSSGPVNKKINYSLEHFVNIIC